MVLRQNHKAINMQDIITTTLCKTIEQTTNLICETKRKLSYLDENNKIYTGPGISIAQRHDCLKSIIIMIMITNDEIILFGRYKPSSQYKTFTLISDPNCIQKTINTIIMLKNEKD